MRAHALTISLALFLLPATSSAQTYTQMQWGMDKTVTPYAFGANINGTWRNLGTISPTGDWSIAPSSMTLGDLVVTKSDTATPIFNGKMGAFVGIWNTPNNTWSDYFGIQIMNAKINGGNTAQRWAASAHGMLTFIRADENNGLAGSHAIAQVARADIPYGLPDGGGYWNGGANASYQEIGAFAGNTYILSDGHYAEGVSSYSYDNDGVHYAKAHMIGFFAAMNKGTADNSYPYYGYQAYSYGLQQTTYAPRSAFRVDGGWLNSLDLRGNTYANSIDIYFPNNHSITHDATNTYINNGTNSTIFNSLGVTAAGFTAYGTINAQNMAIGTPSGSTSQIEVFSGASSLFTIGKNAANIFYIYDVGTSKNAFTIASGVATLGETGVGGAIVGTTSGGNATAGNVGEVLSLEVLSGSATTLTTGAAVNVGNSGLSLTAGDWDCNGNVSFLPAGTTSTGAIYGWISTTSATNPGAPNKGGFSAIELGTPAVGYSPGTLSVGPFRVNVSTTTTVYLGALSNFSASTNKAYGYMACRRVR